MCIRDRSPGLPAPRAEQEQLELPDLPGLPVPQALPDLPGPLALPVPPALPDLPGQLALPALPAPPVLSAPPALQDVYKRQGHNAMLLDRPHQIVHRLIVLHLKRVIP